MFDVCIVGGGPAGAALAIRLAQLGRTVALIEKSADDRRAAYESLPAGIAPQLALLGVGDAVAAAGFVAAPYATVRWGGEHRHDLAPGGGSLLVDRARFDAILRAAAARQPGVELRQPARVVAATRADDHWRVALADGAPLHARLLAEASGRAPVLRRQRRRIGASTLALSADVHARADAGVVVDAGEHAWSWAAPRADGDVAATVFIDAGRVDRAAVYDAVIARVLGGERCTAVTARDATSFADADPVAPAAIKLGDAALSLDPLSSQGVQTAIGTAVHAAIVLNTWLDRPDDRALATEFYRARIRESVEVHAAAAAALYRRHAAVVDTAFWRRRATAAPPPREAIEPAWHVRLADDLRFATVAIASDAYVERARGLTCGGRSYAFIGPGLPLAPLLQQIGGPILARDVVARWAHQLAPTRALQVLQWAAAEGLIIQASLQAGLRRSVE